MKSGQRSFGICVIFWTFLMSTSGYNVYQSRIPNGKAVPHPCLLNHRWPGVGHENRNGGGARNAFGLAFKEAGLNWTQSLCQQDSDGDGRTNGDELGDPNCVWSVGQVPTRTTGITHPGVCEPIDSSMCLGKNSFVSCKPDAMESCDVIKSPDVQNITVTFPNISLPARETTYYCMTFELPRDKEYHIVANEGVLDNPHLLHHMVIYGCEESVTRITAPSECKMTSPDCTNIISSWTLGRPGECFGDKIGYRIGQKGYKVIRLEIHYNNPGLTSGQNDSSGFRIYYRLARPGVQDLVTFLTGQQLLEIPPGVARTEQVGTCDGTCSKEMFSEPVYVVNVLNHMHYLGSSMTVELFRNGSKIKVLSNDTEFSYDSPVTHHYDPPVQILPGDDLVTTCVFNSLSTTKWVYYGGATSDEMCLGFLTLYPKDAVAKIGHCVNRGPLSTCQELAGTPVDGCNWRDFVNETHSDTIALVERLTQHCGVGGECRQECRDLVKTIGSHPCLQGRARPLTSQFLSMTEFGRNLLNRLQSGSTEGSTTDKPKCKKRNSAPTSCSSVTFVLTTCCTFVLAMLIE